MANNNDIIIKVKVDGSDSIKSLKMTDKAVEDLANSMDGLSSSITSGMLNSADAIEDTTDELDKISGSINNTSKAQKSLNKSTEKSKKGLNIIKRGFKAIGTAFKAMGIGLVIAAFAALVAAFKSSEKGQNKLAKITKIFSVILGNLMDILSDIGLAMVDAFSKPKEAIQKLKDKVKEIGDFFKNTFGNVIGGSIDKMVAGMLKGFAKLGIGWQKLKGIFTDNTEGINEAQEKIIELDERIEDANDRIKKGTAALKDAIKGAWDGAKNSLSGFIAEQEREIKIAQELADRQAQLDKDMRKNLVDEAKARRGIAEFRAKAADKEKFDAQERLGFLSEAIEIENIQTDNAIKLAKEKLKLKQINNSLSNSTKEDLQEEAQLQADLINIETASAEKRKSLIKEQQAAINEVRNEAAAADKKAEQDRINEIKSNEELLAEIYKQTEEQKLKMKRDALMLELEMSTLTAEQIAAAKLLIESGYQEELVELAVERKDKKEEDDEEQAEKDLESFKAKLAMASQLFNLTSEIAGAFYAKDLDNINKREKDALASFKGTAAEKDKLEKKFANEREQIKYKQAKSEKTMSIIQAIIGTAQAVASQTSIAAMIAAGLIGLAQVGIIISQSIPAPQTFGRGGMLSGPSHQQGGILTGFGEVEGEEAVINKVSMQNPSLRNIASAVNEAGGGTSFGTGSGAIKIDQSSIAAIVAGINAKPVILNTNELNEKNDEVEIIETESIL